MPRSTIFCKKKVQESLGNRFKEIDKTLITNYITNPKNLKKSLFALDWKVDFIINSLASIYTIKYLKVVSFYNYVFFQPILL